MGDNSRKALIRDIKNEIDTINADIAVLMEQRKKAKGRIKAELGWKAADWNAMCRAADLEEDARVEMLTVMKEGFHALEVGGMINFMDIIDPAPTDKPKRGRKAKSTIPEPEPGTYRDELAKQEASEKTQAEQIAEHVLDDFEETEAALEDA